MRTKFKEKITFLQQPKSRRQVKASSPDQSIPKLLFPDPIHENSGSYIQDRTPANLWLNSLPVQRHAVMVHFNCCQLDAMYNHLLRVSVRDYWVTSVSEHTCEGLS